jgi:hypothetical protein
MHRHVMSFQFNILMPQQCSKGGCGSIIKCSVTMHVLYFARIPIAAVVCHDGLGSVVLIPTHFRRSDHKTARFTGHISYGA